MGTGIQQTTEMQDGDDGSRGHVTTRTGSLNATEPYRDSPTHSTGSITVCEQSDRVRPRATQGEAAADARSATDRTATVVIRGHAFVQNVRRGHYELGVEARHERLRVAAAFDGLAEAI